MDIQRVKRGRKESMSSYATVTNFEHPHPQTNPTSLILQWHRSYNVNKILCWDYSGCIQYDRPHGFGEATGVQGLFHYSGDWKNGLPHGKGVLTIGSKTIVVFEGEWRDGLRHGYGKQYGDGADGVEIECFEGLFVKDKFVYGTGTNLQAQTCTSCNLEGCRYCGQWAEEVIGYPFPHGLGSLTNRDGKVSTGTFDFGLRRR